MDDLSAAVREIMSDPQSMAQIQSLAQSLGLSDAPAAAPQPKNELTDPMLSTLMRIAPLLSAASEDDDSTRLLAALRPLLGQERQKRLDEAGRILRLLRLLPILRDSGLLQNIL